MPKKTLKIIKQTGNETVLQVKGNQEKLLGDCEKNCFNKKATDQYSSKDRHRNRIEKRCVAVYHQTEFTDKAWNEYLKAIIKVKREFKRFDPKTKEFIASGETAYYVSTKILSAKMFNRIIRSHWGIENRNHYVKDVSMGEDSSRIRKNPQNMARLRSFALNLMRINRAENIERSLYRNAMNIEKVLNYKYLC